MKSLFMLALVIPLTADAQGTRWNEAWVGSEWEVYARALADRGMLGVEPWSIRPFAPGLMQRNVAPPAVLDDQGRRLTAPARVGPWQSRLAVPDTLSSFILLRPSVATSYNSGFAWGMQDGPVWQGRGLNAWGTLGFTWRFGVLSARIEPLFDYAQNNGFALEVPTTGTSPYADDLRPITIDLPQRFGNSSFHIVDPGQSYVRIDYKGGAVGFSTENIFWGPGVRQDLLLDANAGGFPHVFIGSSHAIPTPIGRFHAQLIYGRLEESKYAPHSTKTSRFGAGGIGVWMPASGIEIGVARFYHRGWPSGLSARDLFVPFGSFVNDREVQGVGEAENQLLSIFATFRVPSSGFEVFGEFGKNDRNADLRDALAEPEHNSAWLLGTLKVIGIPSPDTPFWTLRAEAASGRVSPIQDLGRGQSTFYDHTTVTQGHTQAGQLLGTPLIDRSGGLDLAVDRWSPRGRLGLELFERQMPPDLAVGLPPDQTRSQWDLSVTGTRFFGTSDLTFSVGHVWDLDRFPDKDVGNMYLRVGFRAALP